ncbi:MAG: hypothetical protein V1729_05915 [Candidatus Woesearchaeota archaeon]
MANKSGESLSSRIAEEAIDEIMMAGIAFLLVITGVNYFNMKWAWADTLAKTGSATPSMIGIEIKQMFGGITTTFPFKYLFVQHDFWGALTLAIVLTVIGLGLKAFTVKTKGKFLIDIGKNLYLPATIGVVGIIGLQIWSAIKVEGYLTKRAMALPEMSSGFFIWETYGILFLVGASVLVIGSIVKLIGEKNAYPKTKMIGDAMFSGSCILIAYYIIIRALSLEIVFNTSVGRTIEAFIISNQFSNIAIIISVFVFSFGLALKRLGVKILRKEKNLWKLDELKQKHEYLKQELGARPATAPPQHPKQLQVDARQHLRHPAYDQPEHPIHRYVHPQGHYKKKRR